MSSKRDRKPYTPRHLGRKSVKPIEKVDLIPWNGSSITISLHCQEFTCLCPVTSQPDFGELIVTYAPQQFIVETKSLKLYLWQFRNVGTFNEALVSRIADELFSQVKPEWLEVEGQFASRGGIKVTARARRQ